MTTKNITKKLATRTLTEVMAVAWRLIYGGAAVIEAWSTDQGALAPRAVKHWCVQRLMHISKGLVRAGERLDVAVCRIAEWLGIDIFDVLTSRVDPRLPG